MRRFLASLVAISLIPIATFAFDYQDRSERYTDAESFSLAESAAISLLTEAGSVSGNPDGSFRPERQLNRAEFLKMSLGVVDAFDGAIEEHEGAHACFPDVRSGDWFHPYVCVAKDADLVNGYPDGFFRPERPVIYVEAVKILSNLFEYDVEEGSGEFWYRPYLNEAGDRGVLIPGSVQPGDRLTRGQAARLVAAYLAESEGELDIYRDAERGKIPSQSSSSRSSVSSRSSSSLGSSSSSVSSGSTPSEDAGFPARSQFLILGERTKPIATASFFASLEPMSIRSVKVVMEDDYESIDAMYLVDANGERLGTLSLDIYDTTDKTWKTTFGSGTGKHFEKDSENVLGIELLLKGRNQGGRSEEMIQVDSFSLTVEGDWSQNTYQNIPADIPYPKHQTAQAEITEAKNALKDTEALPVGTDQVIAGFSIGGVKISGARLAIETLEFEVAKSSSVTIAGVELGATDSNVRSACTVSGQTVSCAAIPPEIGEIGGSPRPLRLFADVTLSSGAQNPFLQVTLNQPGIIGENGAIRWTDGTGHFTWVDMEAPVARGTRFE